MKLIAVYGTLKHGYGLHAAFPDMGFVGVTVVRDYTLYSNGAYPAATPKKGARILAEVYNVPDGTFDYIDDIEKGAGYDLHSIDTEFGPADMWVWPSPPPGWEKVKPDAEGVENWSRKV